MALLLTGNELAFLNEHTCMDYEDRIASAIEKELGKDSGYIRYTVC